MKPKADMTYRRKVTEIREVLCVIFFWLHSLNKNCVFPNVLVNSIMSRNYQYGIFLLAAHTVGHEKSAIVLVDKPH